MALRIAAGAHLKRQGMPQRVDITRIGNGDQMFERRGRVARRVTAYRIAAVLDRRCRIPGIGIAARTALRARGSRPGMAEPFDDELALRDRQPSLGIVALAGNAAAYEPEKLAIVRRHGDEVVECRIEIDQKIEREPRQHRFIVTMLAAACVSRQRLQFGQLGVAGRVAEKFSLDRRRKRGEAA